MRGELAEEKEGKRTVSDINSESDGFWVGDWDETLDNAAMSVYICINTKSVCFVLKEIFVCS